MRGKDRAVWWLVLDGVADRPARELDGQTPLEAAETPNLDRLAAAGTNGTMDVSQPGTPLSSDRAHAILFGYDHGEIPGRGVLEARGFDHTVPNDAVVCSASFGRTEPADRGWIVTDRHLRGVNHDFESIAERVASFSTGGVDVSLTYTWTNRGLVVLESPEPLSPGLTDVDPFECGLEALRPEPLETTGDCKAARRTADALAEYTRWTAGQLADTPVDIVLSKWAGTPTDPPAFDEHHGLEACSLTRKAVLIGLARTVGMDVITPAEAYDARAGDALDAIDEYDFVHVHYPEPDDVSHAAGPTAKRDEIAAIDASLGPVADRALEDDRLVTVVTADHTTPSNEDVVHAGDPVPVTIVAETVRRDDIASAGERPAADGGLGRVRGRDLLRLSRAYADRMLLDGLRRSPAARDYPNQSLTPLRPEASDDSQ